MVPKDGLSLKDILRHFLDFRLATVRRRFEYQLRQLRRRIHILEGFEIIFNALDKAIKIIRESSGKPDAAEKLKMAFKLDDEQATAILDAQLYKIAQMEIKKILDELKEKKEQAEEIEAILASEAQALGRHQGRDGGAGREVRRPAQDADGLGRGRARVRRGSLHRPREHERRADPRRLDQARRPARVGREHARRGGRRGHRRGPRQHARPRRLLRRRRHRVHDADQRGAGDARATASRSRSSSSSATA